MSVKIYHNPACSKSRAALALLESEGHEPVVVKYLDVPPSADELRAIARALGVGPRDFMRKGDALYSSLNLGDEGLSEEALFEAMAENPKLIERPIVVTVKGARIGRPTENILDIL